MLDAYLADEIGEQALKQDAESWQNYAASYRPLIEWARKTQIPVIAANAPAGIVRCVGRHGVGYLERLSPQERSQVAAEIHLDDPPYRAKFMGAGRHGTTENSEDLRARKHFAAQVLSVLKVLRSEQFARERLGLNKAFGNIEPESINIHGGSLAFGHPFGATGTRMVTTMANELASTKAKTALLGLCAQGGQSAGAVMEAVD